MEIHLVAGFLGSGKTTAIIQAAKTLMGRGTKVGVLTNDQGKYLVDTAFFQLSDIPAVEVSGGCFCCNYDDMNARLDQLIAAVHPDVIFAESVGSCADLVATVIKPLLALGSAGSPPPASFSVFADIRLVQHWLAGDALPFSEQVVYIFEKQIEEAGLVILNKNDLVSTEVCAAVSAALQERFPGKHVLAISALNRDGITGWVDQIRSGALPLPQTSLEIDYQLYGMGEASLGWLDEQIDFDLPGGGVGKAVVDFMQGLLDEIHRKEIAIGHMKFIVAAGEAMHKVSFLTLDDPRSWQADLPPISGGHATLMVNARLQAGAQEIRSLLEQAIQRCRQEHGVKIQESRLDYFHPKFPQPTHRIQ